MTTLKRIAIASLALPLLAVVILGTGPSKAYSAPADETAALYKSKCASCHGADGAGTAVGTKMGARSFKSAEVKGQSDAALLNITLKGKGKMPGYEKSLGADKCKALVSYIRANLMK